MNGLRLMEGLSKGTLSAIGRVAPSAGAPAARRRFSRTGFLLLLLCALSGCAGDPPPPPPIPILTVEVIAAADVNPDRSGRASPIAVSIMQLKSADAFLKADYFAIADPMKPLAGDDLLSREEMMLQPGETRRWSGKLDDAALRLGVIGAYRDIERSAWRAEAPISRPTVEPPGQVEVKVTVRVGATAVSIETGITEN